MSIIKEKNKNILLIMYLTSLEYYYSFFFFFNGNKYMVGFLLINILFYKLYVL